MNSTVIACSGGNCPEITPVEGGVELTSTVSPDRGSLFYDADEWAGLVAAAKDGRLDATLTAGSPAVVVEGSPVAA